MPGGTAGWLERVSGLSAVGLVHCPGAVLVGSWCLSRCGLGLSRAQEQPHYTEAVLVVWPEVLEWVQAGGRSWGNKTVPLTLEGSSSSPPCL